MAEQADADLDLVGLKCPLPVLHTRRALRLLAPGAILVVRCSDPLAAIDIPNLVREEGARLDHVERSDGALSFTITARAGPAA